MSHFEFRIGADNYQLCEKLDAENKSCNGILHANQFYFLSLYAYTSLENCGHVNFGYIQTARLLNPKEHYVVPIFEIFLAMKILAFLILIVVQLIANSYFSKEKYFWKKQRDLSKIRSNDPVFSYRYPLWVKNFDSFMNSEKFHEQTEEQFDSLNRTFPFFSRKSALLKENFYRNRFNKRHLPFEEHLVSLSHVNMWQTHSEGYINASFIPGPTNQNPTEYILAQDPMKLTVNNFLHLIYSHDIKVVTAVVGKDEDLLYDYMPKSQEAADPRRPVKYYSVAVEDNNYTVIGDFEVRNKSWNVVGSGCRELMLRKRDNLALKKKVIQFTFDLQIAENKEWDWSRIDEVLNQLDLLHTLVKKSPTKGETETKFLAHCSTGDRFSGLVVAAYRLQREIQSGKFVDVMGCVADMRRCRNIRVIPNIRQYKLLHLIVYRYVQKCGYRFTHRWKVRKAMPAILFQKTDMESISDDSFSSVSFNLDTTGMEDSVANKSDKAGTSDYTLIKISLSESDSVLQKIKQEVESIENHTLASSYPTYRSSHIRESASNKSSYGVRSTDATTVVQTDTLGTPMSSKVVRTLESSVQTSPSVEESFSASSSEQEVNQSVSKRPSMPLSEFQNSERRSGSSKYSPTARENFLPRLPAIDQTPPPILPRKSISSSERIKYYTNRFYAERNKRESPRNVSLPRADEGGFETLARFTNTIVRKGNYDVGQSPEGSKKLNVPRKSDDLITSSTEYFRATARDIERRKEVVPAHLRPQKKKDFVKTAHTFTAHNFMRDFDI